MVGYIHSFETFGTVDGPGIRFVLFLKGCPLRCLYCHNPDTWTLDNSLVLEASEVLKIILKYKSYYLNGGGITISGGEPLMQLDFLIELTSLLKKEGLHVAIDTSGVTFKNETNYIKKLKELLNNVDLVMLDLKQIDNKKHQELTGKGNENILAFARFLDDLGVKMWIRHVLIPGLTTSDTSLNLLKNFLRTLKNVLNVEVLPYHTLGLSKYQKLNIEYKLKDVLPPSKDEVLKAKLILNGKE